MTDTDRYSKSTTNLTDMLAAWREMHHAIIPVRELFGDGACIFECLIVALAEGRTEDLSDELDDYTRASPEVFRRDLNNCIMKARQAMPEIMESWDRFQKVMGGT